MSYAENTSVPIGRSQDEIRRILGKYKASGFAFGEQQDKALVAFVINNRQIRFVLPMPVLGVTTSSKNKYRKLGQKEVDQLSRSRWRCLVLAIKAKLECVESGITTLEQEFLAHIVLPNGKTVGDTAIPAIAKSYADGSMPPLLGYDG